MKNYYPEVDIQIRETTANIAGLTEYLFRMSSLLRVKHETIWYDVYFWEEYKMIGMDLHKAVSRLHTNVYMFSQLGIIDLNVKDRFDAPIYRISDTQIDEKERLKQLNKIGII